MIQAHLGRRLMLAVAVLCPLSSSLASAGDVQDAYYRAYFLEQEKGDFAAAAKLYSRVVAAKDVDAGIKAQARARLAACREEIASSDLLRLMPPDALAYAELNRPGEQLAQLLKSLGLLAGDQPQLKAGAGRRIAVSPVLIKGLLGLRGAAVAITGFDPGRDAPTGVIVINPGNLQVLRGVLESVLPAAAETVEAIRGRQTFFISDAQVYVCLTSRLIIASPDRSEISNVLGRLDGTVKKSLATVQGLPEVFAQRDDSMLFFCVNVKALMPMIDGMMALAGGSREVAIARALLDPKSLRSFAKRSKISQSTLSHLRAGERRWIQRRTYERLRRCAGPWGLRLERCFGGDAAAVIRDEAADWFGRELDRPEAKRGLSAVERKRLRSLYEESPRLRRAVERLNRALSATDSQVGRRLAAYCSAVAPLNRFFETGGLERGFNELSDTELANFVAWGLDRERVLLHRPRDVIRRQWMSANFENFNEQKARRSSELGKADATCSWDFMNAERLYANKTLANDWAE